MNLVLPLQQTQAALTLLFLPYAARIHGQEGSAGANVVNHRITMFVVASALAYWATIIPLRTTVFQFLYSGKYMEVAYLVPVVAINGVDPNSAANRDYAPGFMTDLMAKDLALAVNAAREKRVPTPVAAAAQQVYRMASAHGLGRKDCASVYRFLAPSKDDAPV